MNKHSLHFEQNHWSLFLFCFFACFAECLQRPTSRHFSDQKNNALGMHQENTRVWFGKLGSKIGPYMTFPSLFPLGQDFFFFFKKQKATVEIRKSTQYRNWTYSGKSRRVGSYALIKPCILSMHLPDKFISSNTTDWRKPGRLNCTLPCCKASTIICCTDPMASMHDSWTFHLGRGTWVLLVCHVCIVTTDVYICKEDFTTALEGSYWVFFA